MNWSIRPGKFNLDYLSDESRKIQNFKKKIVSYSLSVVISPANLRNEFMTSPGIS